MMNKKTEVILGLVLVVFIFGISGCGQSEVTSISENASSSVTGDSTEAIALDTFVFEGENYTLPILYDDIKDLGWSVTEDTYDVLSDGDTTISYLELENENYPNVLMELDIKDALKGNGYNSVEEIEQDLEENGAYGIYVYSTDTSGESLDYPEFSFGGITFENSIEEAETVFGTLETHEEIPDTYWAYFKQRETIYSLMFDVDDGKITGISAGD